MLDGKNLNDMLAAIPFRASGETKKLTLTAGQTLKFEYSPNGEELILGVVPEGKKWIIHAVVHVEEVDA